MTASTPRQPGFIRYHGRMAEAVRQADWDSSPLGPLESWPPSLKTALGIVLGAASAKVLLWGPDLITFYNDACIPLIDHSNHQIGRRYPACESRVWPTIRPHVEAAMADHQELRAPSTGIVAKAGDQTGYFTICCTSICDDDGNVLGTITDISETAAQGQLREVLAAENKRFRELFDQAPVFLVLTSGPEFQLEYANKAFERLVGRGSLIGKTADEAIPELAAQGCIDLLGRVYESGEPQNFRHLMVEIQVRPGGPLEPRFLDFVYQPIISGTKVTGLLAVGQDVTEQHFAEERAEALRDELLRASRLSAMGTVASTLAHELNQPLTAIKNYAVGSRTLLESNQDDRGALDDALRAISDNAQRAGEVIRRLCDMTERGMVRKEIFDLEKAAREAAGLANTGDCTGIGFSYDLAPGARASADRIQVQQVLLNLLRNACEACEGATRPEVCISTTRRGEWLEVRVRDTGPGVSLDAMPNLFEPFLSTKLGGMGLGLWISRTIVESQGGRIWAEDVPGGGAVFCFTIPKA